MNGLLVRVGIDSTDGRWNAPMRLATGEFAYVTITGTEPLRDGMARYYDDFIPVVQRFGKRLPPALPGTPTHLDPDFDQLTYGDQGQRGKRIASLLTVGDLLAFFSAMRPVDGPKRPLIYALIGLYVIAEMIPAKSVPQSKWADNAHTRRVPGDCDIVIRAKPGVSGRLRRCIPFGELRDGMYRVRNDLLDAWGDLSVKNGYIQRSVWLPAFHDTEKFYRSFPGQQGFSPRNLKYMRAFAEAWPATVIVQRAVAQIATTRKPDPAIVQSPLAQISATLSPIVQAPLAQLPWRHHTILLDKLSSTEIRLWYAGKAVEHGWSGEVLALQIEAGLHQRQGKAVTNFKTTLPPAQSDLAQGITKDPYVTKLVDSLPKALKGAVPSVAELEKGLAPKTP